MRRTQAKIFADFEATLANVDFTPGSFGVLTLIRANPGITQVALAAAFGVDKSTMSPVIVRLEKRGLIRREVLASDRRCHALYLEASAEPQFLAAREKVRAFEARRGVAPLQARAARAGAAAGQAARRRDGSVAMRALPPCWRSAQRALTPPSCLLRLNASNSSRMIRTAMRICAGVCSEVMKKRSRAAFKGTAG